MVQDGPQELDYNHLTVFDSHDIPPVSIRDYLIRIMSYSRATSRNMVMALSYIDKLSNDDNWPVTLTRFNVHRLLAVSMMIASKFYEDQYLDNDSWGTITGMGLPEINRIERRFLLYIDFDINTRFDSFINYVQLLVSFAVENGLISEDVGRGILQSIVDAAVQEISDSDTGNDH